MLARSRALGRRRSTSAANNAANRNHSQSVERLFDCNTSMAPCDQRIFVKAALNQLPIMDRELIELAFFSGLSHPELAATLNLPLGTVKSRIRTAISRLRDLIQ
jgi:RNA polymerase sigma-70 factor (ECF subfamily)